MNKIYSHVFSVLSTSQKWQVLFSCSEKGDCGKQQDKRKIPGRSEREMTTPLFLLRCTEVGISIRHLDLLTIGVVLDMWTEKANDGVKYRRLADQSDFDKF